MHNLITSNSLHLPLILSISLFRHLNIDFFPFDLFLAFNLIPTDLLPHGLELRIFLNLFPIIGPLNLIFFLGLHQNIAPVFGLQFVLNLFNILVRVIQHVNHLHDDKLLPLRSSLTFTLRRCFSWSLATLVLRLRPDFIVLVELEVKEPVAFCCPFTQKEAPFTWSAGWSCQYRSSSCLCSSLCGLGHVSAWP